ncbi:MAG: hypothetical protein AAGA54_26305 [Myxococcota bacterium]
MVKARLSLLAALGVAACGIDLPEEALLEGPRVLAVRIVPEESEDARPSAALAPGTPASTETLIVDDLGPHDPSSMSALWVACPLGAGRPAFSCLQEAVPVDRDALPACPEGDDPTQPLPAPCILSEAIEPNFTVPAFEEALSGARLELTLVLALDSHDDVDACADALFRGDYDTPEGCIYTSYALTLTGLEQPGNRHPAPGVITASAGGEPVDLVSGTTFSVPQGQNVTLAYVPTNEDTESYEVPVNNGTSFQTLVEEPSARWFRTGGEFVADGPLAFTGDVEVALPDEGIRVYAVLRDGRGGVGWWWADLVPE